MKARLGERVPSGRELLWFAVWTVLVLVLVLVYFAKEHFVWESEAHRAVVLAETEREGQPAIEPGEMEGNAAWPLSGGQLDTLDERFILTPRKSLDPPVMEVTSGKSGWNPDSPEVAGDARRINPEEVKWLKERLEAVAVESSLPVGKVFENVLQHVRRVGRIPYVAQTHGWGLPEDTLLRNEGDCADKSLLLAEKLIAAGLEEVAICIGVGPDYEPGAPGHAWVQAMIGDRLWRIESTSGQMRVANSGSALDMFEAVATIWRLGK
ncbi:hypothetical protein [Pelagicoccus sp. SDUM812002]|uniref:hypothetical protein n=1 Tax=Pelagicoccus sp. SDUM812002 TaxID=3041266 RepID=UPI00280E63B3|nr:hypothetical protein [Pelagicoccus sp. SDUM812002]MDQ8187089.1 hypothetical protein [Pelagicoccus sp. SDUM812002]